MWASEVHSTFHIALCFIILLANITRHAKLHVQLKKSYFPCIFCNSSIYSQYCLFDLIVTLCNIWGYIEICTVLYYALAKLDVVCKENCYKKVQLYKFSINCTTRAEPGHSSNTISQVCWCFLSYYCAFLTK